MAFVTYYDAMIAQLSDLARMKDKRAVEAREHLYYDIRNKSGLEFEDYGDEPERWVAWMRANDTKDFDKARQIRDENIRRREAKGTGAG